MKLYYLKNKLNLFKKSINLTMEFGLSPMYMLSTCPKTEQHPQAYLCVFLQP